MSEVSEIIDIILKGGPWILFLVFIIYILNYPEKVQKWASLFSKLFASVSIKMEKSHISKDIQYKLNSYRKKINKECDDLVPYKTEIKFVNPASIRKTTVKHEDKRLIIIMRNRKNQDENFIKAAMISTENNLIPNSRKYIDRTMMKSIDLQYVKNLIIANKKILLNYFVDKCLGPELKENGDLEDNLRILQKLTNRGIFTRILLQEINDYGANFFPEIATKQHFTEPLSFFNVLEELANKEHQVDINPNYTGRYIKVSIVLIGRPHVVFKHGELDIGPYINWILNCEEKGIRTIYLLAMGRNIRATDKICKHLDLMPSRFQKVSESKYKIEFNNKNYATKCIRYKITENL